jgi:hypothetical protein
MFDLAAAYQFVGSPRICRFGGPRERTTQSDQAAHLVGYDLGELAGIETAQATADEAQSASAVALEQLIDTRQHVALEVGTQTEVAALLPAMCLVAMRIEEAPERAGAVVLRLQHKDRMPIAARDDGGEPRPRMLRIYFLQQWYALAGEALEDAPCDSQALCGFAGIELNRDPVSDATTYPALPLLAGEARPDSGAV